MLICTRTLASEMIVLQRTFRERIRRRQERHILIKIKTIRWQESFQQLAIYFEILHDPTKRKEYDQKWKAKRDAIKRMESMDSSRRKLKEELEAREAAAMALRKRQFETVAKQQAADQIRRDWERHNEEMKWQAERKRKSASEETDNAKLKCTKSGQAVVRVSFNPFLERNRYI
ncbi:unnamed protein product [Schistosoma spindalis]|nr:unnamed protein product [Schistosoma spindale]